jgi:predicted phage terminase large subunit-like protein
MNAEMIAEISRAAQIEQYRRESLKSTLYFTRYTFSKIKNRKFVVADHHKIICSYLDKVFAGEIDRLLIAMPPRYTKTETAVKSFIKKGLAHNPRAKFIHLSGGDDLALDNSEEIREDVKHPEYQRLFPRVQIRRQTDSKKKWYTTEGGGVYATAAGGQVTGFGAGIVDGSQEADQEFIDLWDEFFGGNLTNAAEIEQEGWQDPYRLFGGALIIDDALKPEDAESEQKRTTVNRRFDTTIRSRVNSRRTPIIVLGHRLHPNDLIGHILESEPGVWTLLSLPAIKEDGTALWPEKQTIQELRELERIDKVTFERQYMQNPKPREGLLYKDFKTYSILPSGSKVNRLHVDVADQGSDNLCAIDYVPINNLAYVVDVIHTKERAEETEISVAEMASRHEAELARVESNGGGRFFGRNMEKQCRALQNYQTRIEYYAERQNKESRILNNASAVNNFFVMPEGWERLFPSFYKEVSGYMAVGKNAHDDGPDTLTGIYEHEVVRAGYGYKRKN